MITGSLDSTIKIWEPNTGQIMKKYEGHTHQILQIIELLNGDLASSSLDNTINIWSRKDSTILKTIEGFVDGISEIMEVESGSLAIISKGDFQFQVWSYNNTDKNNDIRNYEGHRGRINKLIFVKNNYFFTASDDTTVIRWKLRNEEPEFTYHGHKDRVLCLQFIGS